MRAQMCSTVFESRFPLLTYSKGEWVNHIPSCRGFQDDLLCGLRDTNAMRNNRKIFGTIASEYNKEISLKRPCPFSTQTEK